MADCCGPRSIIDARSRARGVCEAHTHYKQFSMDSEAGYRYRSRPSMKVQDFNFQEMLNFNPEDGLLRLGEDRMLMFRQDSLGKLRRLLFDQVGASLARSVLSRFGYQCGQGDYEAMRKTYDWDSDLDAYAVGPVLHTHEGIVHASVTKLDIDREAGKFSVAGIWRNSYEAEIHLQQFGRSDKPVCHSLAGYVSGYASAFMGRPVLAIETKCVACGDDHCVPEARLLEDWDERADPWRAALENTEYSLSRELERKLELIEAQARAINELSTPIMEIWDDILVLPVIGVVDTRRSMEIMENLLQRIVTTHARCVIIDVTGVEVVDTKTADYLLKVARAAALLGSRCVLTGISPAIAHTLVSIQADMQEIRTLRNLKEGLKDCVRFLGERT